MTESSVNDSILNIKTFHGYLEHIISSFETNQYHKPTIDKISDMIKNYYEEINKDDDSEVAIFDGISDGSLYNSDNDSAKVSEEKRPEDDSEESDTSDEEEDDDESNTSTSLNSQTKAMLKKDEYLTNFTEGRLDDSKISLYEDSSYLERMNTFLSNYRTY